MSDSRLKERRHLLTLALLSPFLLVGCGGGSKDGAQVQVTDATKADVKARAEGYKARSLQKKTKGASKR